MKRLMSLLLMLCLLIPCLAAPALADTPKPIPTIDYDSIPRTTRRAAPLSAALL